MINLVLSVQTRPNFVEKCREYSFRVTVSHISSNNPTFNKLLFPDPVTVHQETLYLVSEYELAVV